MQKDSHENSSPTVGSGGLGPHTTPTGKIRLVASRYLEASELGESMDSEDVLGVCESLIRSERMVQGLIATLPDCVKVLNLEGRLISMSPTGQKLLEIDDITPYLGSYWPQWWSEETAPVAEAAVRAAADGRTISFHASARTMRGVLKWWESKVSPLYGPNGNPERLLCISRDITEQHQADEHLKQSELLFSTAFDSSIMGLVISDAKGVIMRANEAFCRIVGHSMEDVLGKTSKAITHPDDLQQNVEELRKIEEGASSTSFQKRYIRPDRSVVWTQVNVSKTQPDGDDNYSLIVTVEDISAQVGARMALQERETHLRQIFDSVKDYAIVTVDVDGRVTEWNAGAEKMFGYSAPEMLGQDSRRLWTYEQRVNGVPDHEYRMALENGNWEGERWQQRKDGSAFYASGHLRPMRDEQGRLTGYTKVCQDITREIEASRLLTEAQAKVAQTLETERQRLTDVFTRSSSFMAVQRGPNHVYEFVNEPFLQLVGHRDVLGKSVREALPELEGQGFYELLDQVYTTGHAYQGNEILVRLTREPGHEPEDRYVDFVYLPTRDAQGEINGILTHGVDQTERRSAAKTLQMLAEQRRLALDASGMGWWHLDVQSGKASWDERIKAMLDVDAAELPLDGVLDLMLEEDREPVKKAILAALDVNNPQPYDVEYRIPHRDGTVHWIQSRGRAYFEETPVLHAVSLVGTGLDVTEMKLAQKRLQESEARFRELADAMPQMVFMATPDGEVDYFNQRWYEYTGLPRGTVTMDHWKLVHTEDGLQRALKAWPEAVSTGNPYEIEYMLRREDGVFRWHLGRALPIRNEAGEIIRWFGTNTDINDAKRWQEENARLLASERDIRENAERANRIKDEFLATLSHELRTPLSAILGWCTILSGDPDSEDLTVGLQTIERNARAQSQIITDLLDMSAIISGKVRLHMQPVDLSSVLKTAVETVRPASEAKGVYLRMVIDTSVPPIHGDPSRLQQILWNLLSNAVKFTPKDGKVTVELEREGPNVVLRVSDTGDGISSDFLPHVFDRFRQADATSTRKHGGLGLGLAIVKELVELHGGTVKAESQGLGAGAMFCVAIPVAVLQPEPSPKETEKVNIQAGSTSLPIPSDVLDLSGVKVLVVDDETDARDLIRRFLVTCRATVSTAANAAEALEKIQCDPPDVLISDIGMPGEDGYALMRKVRKLPESEGGNVPAIALTAYARAEDRMKAIAAGFQMHVAKPAEAAELLTMVASLTGRHIHFA